MRLAWAAWADPNLSANPGLRVTGTAKHRPPAGQSEPAWRDRFVPCVRVTLQTVDNVMPGRPEQTSE
jgi:hypothetical protein